MPDTLINAQACDQVHDCTSWDQLFCICTVSNQTDTVCSPATASVGASEPIQNAYPGYNPGFVDSIPGLLGVYSTTATEAGVLASTGHDSATWNSIDNAKQDDGTYADITPASLIHYDGLFTDNCVYGTEYIVLTGFGFNLLPNAIIHGISVGAKGYAYSISGVFGTCGVVYPRVAYNSAGNNNTYIFNVALMLDSVPFYRADPRTDATIRQVAAGANPVTMVGYVNCGNPASDNPYPLATAIDSFGLPVLPYSQPLGSYVSGIGGFEMPSGYSANPVTLDTPPLYTGTIKQLEAFVGTTVGCPPQFFDTNVAGSPVEKDMYIPTLKQAWTVADINNPSFGVAISVYGKDQSFMVSNGTGDHVEHMMEVVDQQFLDSVGICVYYTLGPTDGGGDGGGTGGGGGTGDGTGISVHVSQAVLEAVVTTDSGNAGGPNTRVSQVVLEVAISGSNIGGTPIPCGGTDCGCGGGTPPPPGGGGGGGAESSDCYSRAPSSVWEASVNSSNLSNDGKYSQMLRLKDNQDLTNVDPITAVVSSPWYAKCLLSALMPCSAPYFIAFGGFWNWTFQNQSPDLLFTMRVGLIFFDSTYTFVSENVWDFDTPTTGMNSWQQLPGGSLVVPVPTTASFFRYQCLAMVAVTPNGGVPKTINTGTANYASLLFDSLYAIQQGTGSFDGPLADGSGTGGTQGQGSCGEGGGGGTGGTGTGTGNTRGGGGNPSGNATVTSTTGTLSYKTNAASSGTDPHDIQLDWDAAPNIPDPVTSFNVYRGTQVGSETLLATTADGDTHTYTDSTASPTTTYYYYVTAVNIDGESDHLSDVQVTVPQPGGFIEWDWHGVTIFWSDGSISAPPDGIITQSGLPDGELFFYFPFYDFQSNTVQWVTGGSGDLPAIAFVASTPGEIATQSLTGRIPLFPNLSAGTSGGPPGGGF